MRGCDETEEYRGKKRWEKKMDARRRMKIRMDMCEQCKRIQCKCALSADCYPQSIRVVKRLVQFRRGERERNKGERKPQYYKSRCYYNAKSVDAG